MRVGYIGMGIMGSGMARNLIKKGHAVTVWNRNAERSAPLREAGAAVADSPRALAAGVEVVCTCVSDPAALAAVSEGANGFLAGLKPGTLVIDFSTVGPAAVQALEDACRARDVRFLAAPVTGSKKGAENGTLVLMCGGPADTFAAAQPVLTAVGAKAILVGDARQAAQMKLVGNLILAHMLEALSEGTALASGAGISIEKVLEVLQATSYSSPFWEFKGKALAARDFSTNFSVDLMHKDLTLAIGLGQQHGVPLPGAAAIREVYQIARAQGLGEQDIAATAAVISPALVKR